jgi:hypothetical protein
VVTSRHVVFTEDTFPRHHKNPSTQQHISETKEGQHKSQSETEFETSETDSSLSSEMSSEGYSEEQGDATDDKDFLSVESEDNDESDSVADGGEFDGDDAPETRQQIAQSTHTYNLRRRPDTTNVLSWNMCSHQIWRILS